MTTVCQNCRKPNPGTYYDLITATSAVDSDAYPDRLAIKLSGDFFGNFQREKIFICDQCAGKAKRNQKGFLVLALLLLLGIGGAGILSLLDWIEGKAIGFISSVGTIIALLFIPLLLFWMFTLMRDLLRKGISYKNGESVASLVRQVSANKEGRFTWTPKDFKGTFKTSSPAESGANGDGFPVINLDQ